MNPISRSEEGSLEFTAEATPTPALRSMTVGGDGERLVLLRRIAPLPVVNIDGVMLNGGSEGSWPGSGSTRLKKRR